MSKIETLRRRASYILSLIQETALSCEGTLGLSTFRLFGCVWKTYQHIGNLLKLVEEWFGISNLYAPTWGIPGSVFYYKETPTNIIKPLSMSLEFYEINSRRGMLYRRGLKCEYLCVLTKKLANM